MHRNVTASYISATLTRANVVRIMGIITDRTTRATIRSYLDLPRTLSLYVLGKAIGLAVNLARGRLDGTGHLITRQRRTRPRHFLGRSFRGPVP